jgi:hypothetical protein
LASASPPAVVEQVAHQRPPVGQPGELIGVRQPVQGPLQMTTFADVADVHHQRRHLGHGPLVGDSGLGVPPDVVAVPQSRVDQRGRPVGVLTGQHGGDHRLRVGGVVGVDQVAEGPADHLGVGQPEQPGGGRRLPADPQTFVEDQGEVGGAGDQRAEVRFLLPELARVGPDVADDQQLAGHQHGDHGDAEQDRGGVERAVDGQVVTGGDDPHGRRHRQQRVARQVLLRLGRLDPARGLAAGTALGAQRHSADHGQADDRQSPVRVAGQHEVDQHALPDQRQDHPGGTPQRRRPVQPGPQRHDRDDRDRGRRDQRVEQPEGGRVGHRRDQVRGKPQAHAQPDTVVDPP